MKWNFNFTAIQKSVWEFWGTNKPNYKKWHSLRLNAQLENGYFIYPIGGYTFEDSEELPDEPKRIEIAGVFRHIIEDYFKSTSPKPFVIFVINSGLTSKKENLSFKSILPTD